MASDRRSHPKLSQIRTVKVQKLIQPMQKIPSGLGSPLLRTSLVIRRHHKFGVLTKEATETAAIFKMRIPGTAEMRLQNEFHQTLRNDHSPPIVTTCAPCHTPDGHRNRQNPNPPRQFIGVLHTGFGENKGRRPESRGN